LTYFLLAQYPRQIGRHAIAIDNSLGGTTEDKNNSLINIRQDGLRSQRIMSYWGKLKWLKQRQNDYDAACVANKNHYSDR
jgi:hypothetical protein